MRYFAEISYLGTSYNGWQRQPNAPSVQQKIEEALSTILQTSLDITGCGRTDTGVHAAQFFFHFDLETPLPKDFLYRLNKFLPPDIAIRSVFEVAPQAHARFDAASRSYAYHLLFHKNPFSIGTAYYYPLAQQLDRHKMQQAAGLLLNYQAFYPFCKSHTDVKTMQCQINRSTWVYEETPQKMIYHISANRFLRGMVRLIVGMCINVGLGQLELSTVKKALDNQTRLQKSYSAPPQGLFLRAVVYPQVEENLVLPHLPPSPI